MARYVVQPVGMFDVVDTRNGDVIFNTRDEAEAKQYAEEYEKVYNTPGGADAVYETD